MITIGFLDIFKKKPVPKSATYAKMLSGQAPIFTQFGQNIYASDVVQQAIACIVQEISKLRPMHVRQTNSIDLTVVSGNVQNVLNAPNPIMTTSDFLEKITWNLFFNYNAFVLPVRENGNLTALYPLQPSNVEFLEDVTGTLYIRFTFRNGYRPDPIKAENIIHIRKNYSVNDYMGGNEFGQPDNDALLKTLGLNHTLLQGLSHALKTSFSVSAVVKYNTMMDNGTTEKAIKDLEEHLKNSENGLLPLDLKAEYIPIVRDVKFIDDDTLKFIDEKILRYFGVPLCILKGDYTKEQYEAFYQKTLEPIVLKLSQAFTKGIFTQREISGYLNKIVFFEKELIFMTTSQKLEFAKYLGDRGDIYENELRAMFGLNPLPELEGVRKQSLNYIDSEIANEYQLQGKGKQEGDNDNA